MAPQEHGPGRDLTELTIEELEAQGATMLPDREAMSIIDPSGSGPALLVPPDETPIGPPIDAGPPDATIQPVDTVETA